MGIDMLPTSFKIYDTIPLDDSAPQRALSKWYSRCLSPNDRTGITKNLIELTNDSPLDFTKPVKLQTFADLCDERGVQMLAMNKQIELYWSGGIDSTVALVSLLKAGAKDQLVVRCTKESQDENPEFYKDLIRSNVLLRNVDLTDSGDPSSIISSGELADQLFGGGFAFNGGLPNTENVFVPYEDIVPPDVCAYVAPVIARYPRPVKTIVDFVGVLQLVYNWQYVKDRWNIAFGGLDRGRTKYFFDTPAFQTWSLYTDEQKVRSNKDKKIVLHSFKAIARDYIFNFNKDAQYHSIKTKQGSHYASATGIHLLRGRLENWKYVMEDGSIVWREGSVLG